MSTHQTHLHCSSVLNVLNVLCPLSSVHWPLASLSLTCPHFPHRLHYPYCPHCPLSLCCPALCPVLWYHFPHSVLKYHCLFCPLSLSCPDLPPPLSSLDWPLPVRLPASAPPCTWGQPPRHGALHVSTAAAGTPDCTWRSTGNPRRGTEHVKAHEDVVNN